ncbi:MAG: flagellar motor stator protein MotA [bacterium]|nr:flagellar motor stator protein MotA [bacterium]MBK8127752.1 flagellar motor stator protein MotA [bacterium]
MAIVGIIVVLGGVLGGFMMAGGSLGVLFQPSEFIVIGCAAIGGLLISVPIATLKNLVADIVGILKGNMGPSRDTYIQTLLLLNELFQMARKDGIIALESHVNDPHKSKIFQKYPKVSHDHGAVSYICDTIKLFLAGSVPPHEIEMLMDAEIDSHHEEAGITATVITKIADALPGLGIVAAVLGIIITMGHIDGDPAVVGGHVAAALVGTFLGVLMAYGFFSPMAANLEARNRNNSRLLHVIKAGICAFAKGMAPSVSVEFARRSIFHSDRPSFEETEKLLKDAKNAK